MLRFRYPELDSARINALQRCGTEKPSLQFLLQSARAANEKIEGGLLRDASFVNPKTQNEDVRRNGIDQRSTDKANQAANRHWDQYAPFSQAIDINNIDYTSLDQLVVASGNSNSLAALIIRMRRRKQQLKAEEQQREQDNARRQLRPRPLSMSSVATSTAAVSSSTKNTTTATTTTTTTSTTPSRTHSRRICHFAQCDCNEQSCSVGKFRQAPCVSSNIKLFC